MAVLFEILECRCLNSYMEACHKVGVATHGGRKNIDQSIWRYETWDPYE